MRHSQRSTLPAKVEQVREQLECWRRTRQQRSPIPETIWSEAARLARECGVSVVSKALRLSYPDLKRRAQAVTHAEHSAEATAELPNFPAKLSSPAFIEVACGPYPSPASLVAELENPAGLKMKISLRQGGSVELAALVAAFGSQAG
jgi:hypothetical protein